MDISNVEHNATLEKIVDIICARTQNEDKGFFRVEVLYFLGKIASAMRAKVFAPDRGTIPVNIYALCLATSGYSKGRSVNLLQDEIFNGFIHNFMNSTFPNIAEQNLAKLIKSKADDVSISLDMFEEKIRNAYNRTGPYLFTFDSGTVPAVKQLRQKLLMSGIGSINLQVDEVGSNLLSLDDLLKVFLELYDVGNVNQKIIKNTNEQIRDEELDGKTPANMLLFGTPVRIFDGGTVEDTFYKLLDTGYARRLLFGFGRLSEENQAYYKKSIDELYEDKINPKISESIQEISNRFSQLAHYSHYDRTYQMSHEVAKLLLEYEVNCKKQADSISEHFDVKKQELSHRYFRAMKIAGIYAFIDSSPEVTKDHLLQAIKIVEESGNNFKLILTRAKPYMRLAQYLASVEEDVTHADLTEALPFYKTSISARTEIMSLAMAWGYKNHILIKKTLIDGIEFFSGEALEETSLDKLIVSTSYYMADNYANHKVSFDQLVKLCKAEPQKIKTSLNTTKVVELNWCNHHFSNMHRCNDSVLPEFNLVVLDVDGGITLNTAKEVFKEYTYIMYTTKRHLENGVDRFRIILPISHVLRLTATDYKKFMNNIISWMPFSIENKSVDEASNQIAKKWLSNHNAEVFTNNGELLSPFPFISNTSRNEEFNKNQNKIANLDGLEKWFLSKATVGDRNNQLYSYAICLIDNGVSFDEMQDKVIALNKRLKTPLSEKELADTIFSSISKKIN